MKQQTMRSVGAGQGAEECPHAARGNARAAVEGCFFSTLLSALVLAACGGAQTAVPEKPRGLPVRTASVETRDLDEDLVLTGTLRPRAQVQIVAEVAARLVRVVRDEGAKVAAGETLALLDETDYRLSHERSKAALAVAQANRAHAEAEKERADNLLKTGGITDKDHLSAQVALQVADASLAQARAEEAIAAQQRARTRVIAPFTGRVARRLADPGSMLASGVPIFTLVDDAVLDFRASVPSADWAKVKVGALADVTVDAVPGLRTAGKVARVTPLVEERTRSFEAVVELPGQEDLVGGLFARAAVRVGTTKQALVVPPSALVRDGARPDEAQAFVVVGGKAERRAVGLGVEGAAAVQVTKGLRAGEVVVLDPPSTLGSGTTVEVETSRSAASASGGQ
jgi:membrane fusion protein, multidrug efflux system